MASKNSGSSETEEDFSFLNVDKVRGVYENKPNTAYKMKLGQCIKIRILIFSWHVQTWFTPKFWGQKSSPFRNDNVFSGDGQAYPLQKYDQKMALF